MLQLTTIPRCEYCNDRAVALAPQSTDQGETVSWHRVCNLHLVTWWDGGDWIGDIYALVPPTDLLVEQRVEDHPVAHLHREVTEPDENSSCWYCNRCPEHHEDTDHAPRWAENRPYCPVCPGENR